MAKVSANVQKLIDQRDMLLREIEALRNKVAGIEMAIALMDSHAQPAAPGTKSGASVKTVLLDLLNEVGTLGLSAPAAVDLASRRGITLNQNSVSSTLSRFKTDNVVAYDGERYRLTKYVSQPSRAAEIINMATAATRHFS